MLEGGEVSTGARATLPSYKWENRNQGRERGARPLGIHEQRWAWGSGTGRSQPGTQSLPPILEADWHSAVCPRPVTTWLWHHLGSALGLCSFHLSNEGMGPRLWFSSLQNLRHTFFRHSYVGQMQFYTVAEYLKIGGNRAALIEQGLGFLLSLPLLAPCNQDSSQIKGQKFSLE